MAELPDEVLEHLRNIVTWAALWDATENHDKNRAVYDQVLPYVLPEARAERSSEMTDTTDRITDADRRLAAQARELAAINRVDVLRARYGARDTESALADVWGESAHLLSELAAIVERLDGHG